MKLFRSYSEKQVRKLKKTVDQILSMEEEMGKLSDEELKAKTNEFKERYQKGESLDDLLVEAFAVCREADWRVLGMKPFPVQIMGGIVLHQGRIAEMKTGEGKTLVETLPAYLNGLTGKGVHVVTVNDYLAKRDSEQMGKVYRFLGLSVGLVIHDIKPEQRAGMYAADITYGTNNEFGFDYLRDNMAVRPEDVVQRSHYFAIVDEVDSILIDEARTPLIISGKGPEASDMYLMADTFAKSLHCKRVKEFDRSEAEEDTSVDYVIDEKGRNVILTSAGVQKAEKAFGIENLADPQYMQLSHFINQAIRANGLMTKDIDYIIKDGEIVIVDEFTGRLMFGRRYNDGLHQAIEAKEGVKIANESKTYATITFQNFFRLYDKLSGMTGTALTEDEEFRQIYQLDVVSIPTNKTVARVDHHDHVYMSQDDKIRAIIRQIKICNEKQQPVLVGTVSVEKSEVLSTELNKAGIPHQVLNAKNHEQEAGIIAQAGRSGSVTIATNMAGRGTDIILGGNPEYHAIEELKSNGFPEELISEATGFAETHDEGILEARAQFRNLCEKYRVDTNKDKEKVLASGGLFIIGTERHESRRIDNQLRGRAGRQGDPGESRFFLSLDDDLLRLFIRDGAMRDTIKASMDPDEPIETRFLTRSIENAQRQQEGRNFEVRKNVLQYDDVLNQQREQIYEARNKILRGENLSDSIADMRSWFIRFSVEACCEESDTFTEIMLQNLDLRIQNTLVCSENLCPDDPWMKNFLGIKKKSMKEELCAHLLELAEVEYHKKEQLAGAETMQQMERFMFLRAIDQFWMDHIDNMSHLKNGINLQSYGQHDPVIAYKEKALDMYEEMIQNIRMATIYAIYKYEPVSDDGDTVSED